MEYTLEMADIGKYGEDLASHYLKDNGWIVLDRNYREKFGEIDILARDPSGTLVFVEVKTMIVTSDESGLEPEDNLTQPKLKKMRKIAEAFANRNTRLVHPNRGWRIDLMAISIPRSVSTLTNNNKSFVIKHYQNL